MMHLNTMHGHFFTWDYALPRAQRMTTIFHRVERVHYRAWYRNRLQEAVNMRFSCIDAAIDRIAN